MQEAADEDSDEYYDDEEPRSFFDAYLVQPYIRQFADFSGRSTRKEFWLSYLAYFISCIGLTGLVLLLGAVAGFMGLMIGYAVMGLVCMAATVPFLALSCRRLRDAGKSPWLTLLLLVPAIGPLVLLFMWCSPTDPSLDEEEEDEAAPDDEETEIYIDDDEESEPVKMKGVDWAILGGCIAAFVAGIILAGTSLASLADGDSGYDLGDSYDYSGCAYSDSIMAGDVVVEEVDADYCDTICGETEVAGPESWSLGDIYYSGNTYKIPIGISSPNAFQGYYHEFNGIIDGRYEIHVTLDLENYEGRYRYVNSGSGDYLPLAVAGYDPSTREATILQLDDDNVVTSIFEGRIHENGEIRGWFTNYKGQKMPFAMDVNDAP